MGKIWLTEGKLAIAAIVIGWVVAAIVFYAQAKDLPSEVGTIQVKFAAHCAAQNQMEKDLVERLQRIEDKLDRLHR